MDSFISLWFFIAGGLILFVIIKGLISWTQRQEEEAKNNHAPVKTEKAKVLDKRTKIIGGGEFRVKTIWFVSFETASGERMEFEVKENDYGMLIPGDSGELTWQRKKFHRFKREVNQPSS